MPLLALSNPLHFAVPLVLALDFTASLALGGLNRKQADWSENQEKLTFAWPGWSGGAIGVIAAAHRCPRPRC